MFQLFKSKSTNLLGIDLSVNAIRITELISSKKGICLKNYAVVHLNASYHEQYLHHKLKDIISEMNPCTKHVALAMPHEEVLLKKMHIPADLVKEEISDYVQLEAKQFVSYSFDELYFDYHCMNRQSNDEGQREVLFVACRKTDLEKRSRWVEAAGLNVKVVDIDIYAMGRTYISLRSYLYTKINGIVDINAHKLRLILFKENTLYYFHEEMLSANQSLHQIFTNIMKNYQASNEQLLVEHFILSGDEGMCLKLKQDMQYLGEEKIRIADPFLGISCSDTHLAKNIKQHASEMMISCGLALRSC